MGVGNGGLSKEFENLLMVVSYGLTLEQLYAKLLADLKDKK